MYLSGVVAHHRAHSDTAMCPPCPSSNETTAAATLNDSEASASGSSDASAFGSFNVFFAVGIVKQLRIACGASTTYGAAEDAGRVEFALVTPSLAYNAADVGPARLNRTPVNVHLERPAYRVTVTGRHHVAELQRLGLRENDLVHVTGRVRLQPKYDAVMGGYDYTHVLVVTQQLGGVIPVFGARGKPPASPAVVTPK